MKEITIQLRDLTHAAVSELASARGTTVERLLEGAAISLSWDVDLDFGPAVLRLHAQGWENARIAASLGVPNNRVQAEVRAHGLRSHRRTPIALPKPKGKP